MLCKKKTFLILFISTTFFFSCDDVKDPGIVFQKISLNLENKVMGELTKTQGDAHSGQFFSRISQTMNYGMGYSLLIPDSINSKTIKIILEGWARTNVA